MREKYRLSIGQDVPASNTIGTGVLTINAAGSMVFMSTPTGVRLISLPSANGIASRLSVSGFSTFLPMNSSSTLTVTARDPDGNVATGFVGTVTLSASGGMPTLPPSYTFTPADQGQHSFVVSFGAAGTWSLTASSPGLVSGMQVGLQVHNSSQVTIPVNDNRGMVYDTVRDLLYIATDHGTIERYSPTQRMLLAPLSVGGTNYRG
jgi:hypothetical protein